MEILRRLSRHIETTKNLRTPVQSEQEFIRNNKLQEVEQSSINRERSHITRK